MYVLFPPYTLTFFINMTKKMCAYIYICARKTICYIIIYNYGNNFGFP